MSHTFITDLPSNVIMRWPTGEDDLLTLVAYGKTVTIPRSVMYLLAKSSADKRKSCFCGSFKPYRKCCFARFQYDPVLTEFQGENMVHNVEPSVSCRFPLTKGGVCGCTQVIRSHSSQRSLLKKIADVGNRGERNGNGHVLTMHYNGDAPDKTFGKAIGISDHRVRDLTAGGIFYRFCSKHDTQAFSDIENGIPFVGSPRQFAQIGYRAACYEDYIGRWHHASLRKRVEVRNLMGWPGPHDVFDQIVGTHQMRDIEGEVAKYETSLLCDDFTEFDGIAFAIEGHLGIVGTGFTRVSKRVGSNEGLGALGFGIMPGSSNDGTSYVIFSWRRSETVARQFVESILKLDPRLIPSVLVQTVFSISRSIFFSGRWADSLSHKAKELLKRQSDSVGDYSLIVSKEIVRNIKHVDTIQHPELPSSVAASYVVPSFPIEPYFPQSRSEDHDRVPAFTVVLGATNLVLKVARSSGLPEPCKSRLALETAVSLAQKISTVDGFDRFVADLYKDVEVSSDMEKDWVSRFHRAASSIRRISSSLRGADGSFTEV